MALRFSGSRRLESARAARFRSHKARRSTPAAGRAQWEESWSIGECVLLRANSLSRFGTALAMLVRRRHKGREQRMRLHRLGFKFRMELAAEEPGMVRDLADFHVHRIGGLAR